MRDEIIEAVKLSGVVGAGGAGFPTHIKLSGKCDVVIANAAECEPLLFNNQELIKNGIDFIIDGLRLAIEATGAKRGIIAIKKKQQRSIYLINKEIESDIKLSIFLLEDFYPAGDEHILVYEVLERIIPEAGIPLDIGVVVQNVETLYNISRAVKGINLTEKYVTVNGAVKNPVTVIVPVGTQFKELLDMAGEPTVKDYLLIDGGPMMGKTVSPDDAVSKTTAGLLIIPAGTYTWLSKKINLNVQIKRAKAACCQCRECTDLCPRFLLGHTLEPHKIMRTVANGITDLSLLKMASICCECGLCDIICPMDLNPKAINLEIKRALQKNKVRYEKKSVERHMKERAWRKFPAKKLITRIGLEPYVSQQAILVEEPKEIKDVTMLLKQHVGIPASPVVEKGQKVRKGDLIGVIPEGGLGANLHASIDGIVVEVKQEHIKISNR
jgi:Na+-translocating ferredoxin:NAD+ oxidoreductase RnfC subunit